MINVLLTSFGVLEATGDVFLFWSFHKPSRGQNSPKLTEVLAKN